MSRPALPHAVTRLIPQRGTADCAVACLASYLRVDYEEALLAAGRACPQVLTQGLHGIEIRKAARYLGFNTKWVRANAYDLDEATGILYIEYQAPISCHTVLLIEGVIYDPSHNPVSRWDHSEWYKYYCASPSSLLQTVEPIE